MTDAVAFSDMAPCPRVEVTVDVADMGGADRVTIWRTTPQGQFPVREAVGLDASGGVFVTDYEVPTGVQVVYQVEHFTGGVSTGWGVSLPVFITDFPDGMVCFSDPQVPERAVLVEGKASFADALQRVQSEQLHVAGGRTVALRGRQSLLRGLQLSVQTKTIADADRMANLLDGSTLLVRVNPSAVRIPPALYVSVAAPVEVPMDVQYGGGWVLWDLTGNQVSPNLLPILKATVTWARVVAAYATWDALKAAHPTWQDILRNPPPEM